MAWNAVFKVKSVPAFYTPVIYYPIRHDQRSTGFLFPHFGNSTTRGFDVGSEVFVAHAPERIAAGRFLEEIDTLPCIVGGVGPASGTKATSSARSSWAASRTRNRRCCRAR